MNNFRLAALSVNVMWNFCTIFKRYNYIDVRQMCILYHSCTLRIAEVESVEAGGLSDLRAGGH
jgi:hypothetical protein